MQRLPLGVGSVSQNITRRTYDVGKLKTSDYILTLILWPQGMGMCFYICRPLPDFDKLIWDEIAKLQTCSPEVRVIAIA